MCHYYHHNFLRKRLVIEIWWSKTRLIDVDSLWMTIRSNLAFYHEATLLSMVTDSLCRLVMYVIHFAVMTLRSMSCFYARTSMARWSSISQMYVSFFHMLYWFFSPAYLCVPGVNSGILITQFLLFCAVQDIIPKYRMLKAYNMFHSSKNEVLGHILEKTKKRRKL